MVNEANDLSTSFSSFDINFIKVSRKRTVTGAQKVFLLLNVGEGVLPAKQGRHMSRHPANSCETLQNFLNSPDSSLPFT